MEKYKNDAVTVCIVHPAFGSKLIIGIFFETIPFHLRQWQAVSTVIKSIGESFERTKALYTSFLPSKLDEESSVKSKSDRKAQAKISRYFPQNYASDPAQFLILFAIPLVMAYYNSPYIWLSAPSALGYLTYLQIHKVKVDVKAAMWIIYDANVTKNIIRTIPVWALESEAQRCEWFNSIISLLWLNLSEAVNEKCKNVVNPTLKRDIK